MLDPRGANAEGIFSVVDELCQFRTICLCITSRMTTVPPRCKRPEVPTLSMQAACDIFYSIYGGGKRPSIINDLLRRLDFHALSIALLATVASHNAWDYGRLVKEWDAQRAQVLRTDYNKSLAATIELSLASPTFRSLGPNARDLLELIAFFPQGIDENNLDWLFPTIPDSKNAFDKFCVLSLTRRSNDFVTMLAPIRDYLCPRDPQSSPLLCTTRDRYFNRLSVSVRPGKRGFEEARWIVREDVNVEHLLDRFTSVDKSGDNIWDSCYHFMEHLYWYKPRQTVLGSKIETLADDHPSKPECLSELSRLYGRVGDRPEQKRLLSHALELLRRRGNDSQVAYTLRRLSNVNRLLGLNEEGIRQAKEALEVFERTGSTEGQLQCLNDLAWLLFDNKHPDAAENAASRAIDLVSRKGQEYTFCQLHQVLGRINKSRGEKKKAIQHFETTLEIASPFNWHDILFWTHCGLVELFRDEGEFDDAHAHVKQAKSHTVNDARRLGRAMQMQASVWYRERRLEDARSEALHALKIFEKSGAAHDAGCCRGLLRRVEKAMESRSTGLKGEALDAILNPTSIDPRLLA